MTAPDRRAQGTLCEVPPAVPDFSTLRAGLRSLRDRAPTEEPARAAVATILRRGRESPEVLLIERAKREGDPWSGHIAFPGGRRSPEDPALLNTAVRETREEVGLALPPASFLTRLEDVAARSNGYRVAQFVFALDDDGGALTASDEVARVLWTPMSVLVAPENAATYHFEREGQTFELPSVRLGSHVLWGMTYRMVQTLLVSLSVEE